MSQEKDVLIIGGGVIGMAAAYELSRNGARVTVIDKGSIGHGCSYGNAGWLTPCFSMPLPMPGMFFKALGWLLDSTSPLYIKPDPSTSLLRWLMRFLWSMNNRHLLRSVESLVELSKYSLSEYERLHGETGGAFGFTPRGLLMVSQTDSGMAATAREMELVAAHGVPGELWNEEQIKSFEPAITGRLKGGVYFPKEAHAEPLAVVRTLANLALSHGAEIFPYTEVFGFQTNGRNITAIETTRGPLKANQYVLATGSWSEQLARSLRMRVPVLGGKGYAVIVKPLAPTPRTPIMLLERKIAVTPRDGSLRLAGTLELVDRDDSITRTRVQAIINGSRQFLNVPETPEIVEVWRGLRPCTPDGVPIIGRSPQQDNLIIATGHQMLGLQSAPGTGRIVADLALGRTPLWDLKPFSPARF